MQATYKKQVRLLLEILPEVAKEECFALHGGTAINLFIRDMPRLSVDIDLTYLPIEDRDTSVKAIAEALERIKTRIERNLRHITVIHRKDAAKLQVSGNGVDIKLEVNLTNRGALAATRIIPLCGKAQTEFEIFLEMPVVSLGQLYGGKIVAALDRQHPRDLFDIKYLLATEGITQEIKEGFIHYLLCSDRPIGEVVLPNFQDHRATMDNHFAGMTDEVFAYKEYGQVRQQLVQALHDSLTEKDKEFILSVKNVTPDWTIYDFERFPGIKWKLQNLKKFKEQTPEKHLTAYKALEKKLKKRS
jgi:predicted nucleotidyltransferase component of viral defense system